MSSIKNYIYTNIILFVSLVLFSCSEQQKVLRSENPMERYEYAKKLYEAENYTKALPLIESVMNFAVGSKYAEEVNYWYAYSLFKVGQLTLASYQFKLFAQSFPRNEKTELANYLYAYCLYLESPSSELDQASTYEAINALDYFMDKYPNSEKYEEALNYSNILYNKLETKDINNALLFYKLEDYKASVTALQSVLEKYPATAKAQELKYTMIKSAYLLAEKSIENKKKERYNLTIQEIENFLIQFPESVYQKELLKIKEEAENKYIYG
jgi:outer membrane protein assembly factor BamD